MTETENKIAVEISETESHQMGEEFLNKIVQCLYQNGKLLIIGTSGTGKTTLAMHLVRYIMASKAYKDNKTIIRIADSANVWKLGFDTIPYVDVTRKPSIPDEGTVLIDLGFLSTAKNISLLENMVGQEYYEQRDLMNKNNGHSPITRIYVFEEIQNLFNSYKKSDFWLKIFSEGRNYNQFFVGIGQRLSDINTQYCERTKFVLLGSLSGDNDLQKVRRMYGRERGQRIISAISSLRKGEFLFIDRENTESSLKISVPKFESIGKPFEFDEKQNTRIKAERIFL
jgi:DNA replication protein DnaC